MASTFVVTLTAALFVATHIGLATEPVRSRLVDRLGEWGFRLLYFVVAAATFALAVSSYAAHRFDGPGGPALGATVLRTPLIVLVVAGVALMIGGLAGYGGSPYDVAGRGTSRGPRGLERVTRHPFFVGLAVVAFAHALLATHLVGSLLMLALGVLSAGGAWHQDVKLARLRGAPFERYLAATSALPFAAIASGRQSLVWREIPWGALAAGVGVAFALRAVHDQIFAHGGAWVVGATVGGAALVTVAGWWRERPSRRHAPAMR